MTPHGINEWIIYSRISDDREGAGLGVDRQSKENHAHHERMQLGGTIIAELVDNDLTANDKSKRYKKRPGYEQLCQMLADKPGHRGVITWHTDRLHRTPRELEDFIDLVETTGATVQTVKAGPVDLATPSGRMIARQLCAVARYETEHRTERIRAKVTQLAAAGSIYGGGPRPFGYTRVYDGTGTRRRIVRDDVNPDEAAVVRECARRVIAGHSLNSVRKWLDEQGVTTSTGRPWSLQALRYMLMSGRIAGLRDHLRQVVGTAVWEPIITVQQHQQLRQILSARTQAPGNNARKYYLSGFVWCSDCQAKNIKMGPTIVHGKPRFRCPPERGGCNGRAIGIAGLEAFMDGFIARAASDPKVIARITAREADTSAAVRDLMDQVAGHERKLNAMTAALENTDVGRIPGVIDAMASLSNKVAAGRARIADLSDTTQPALDLQDVVTRWDQARLPEKRAAVAVVVNRIVIFPAVRGRATFDPDRVRVIPAGESVP